MSAEVDRWVREAQIRRSRFMGLVELAIRARLPVPQEVREDYRNWRADQLRRQEAAARELEVRKDEA